MRVLQAVGQLERLPMPLEYARTSFCWDNFTVDDVKARFRHGARPRPFGPSSTRKPVVGARVRRRTFETNVSHAGKVDLDTTEQRVAELAADGLSNVTLPRRRIRDKNVEANLSRVYRKLGVRSRVELGRRMDHSHRVRTPPRASSANERRIHVRRRRLFSPSARAANHVRCAPRNAIGRISRVRPRDERAELPRVSTKRRSRARGSTCDCVHRIVVWTANSRTVGSLVPAKACRP